MAASAVARETIRADIERRAGRFAPRGPCPCPRGASPPALSVSPRRSREIELEAQCAVHHDRDEEQREVQERVKVDGARHRASADRTAPKQSERVRDEESAEDDRGREIDVSEAADDEEQERER